MPRLNLRNKLLLFAVVIAIIPLLIAGQSLIRIARDEMMSSANDQLVATARQVQAEIDNLFEHGWLAPLLLIRNAVDGEGLGVPEKIALLKHGIAELPDIVALQISVVGAPQPLVVSQDRYTQRLRKASLDPLAVLRVSAEAVATAIERGNDAAIEVEYVLENDSWLATVILPLQAPIAGGRAAFSARIDLTRMRDAIAEHPFQRTGSIVVVDADGRQVFAASRADLRERSIVADALSRIGSAISVVSVDRYTPPGGEVMLGASAVSRPLKWAVIAEKTEASAYFAVFEMIKSLGLWIGIGLAAAAAGSVVLAFRISRPILSIGETAIKVGAGDFRARVTGVNSRDEIGDLAQRFNEMIVHLNERFQLAKFVSGGTMAAIKSSDHEGVKLGGERREVAILFADIRGFTSFSEKRSPEAVVEALNYYFQQLADVVVECSGDIDKYVGDQIMATFQGPNMAENAVHCCLRFNDVMAELARKNPDSGLEVGCGVDVGEVVMGAMGSKERMDYTVLGDHVNVAARLCSHAAPRQTLVTGRVFAQMKNSSKLSFEELAPIQVKGKAAAIEVYLARAAS